MAKTKNKKRKKTTANSKKNTKKNVLKKSANKKRKSIFLLFFKWSIIFAIWFSIFIGGIVLWFAKDLPDITQSATFERRNSIIIKASNGDIIARYGETKGSNLQVDELPEYLINAVLAIEDRRFYSHFGIDPLGIARAMLVNISKGKFVQGGSTITQQLAKNLFLTHERKIERKIKEAILAIWLERELDKDEILSAYMNRVYLGSGTYGFEAAAQLYFGKSARNVNLREAAILAGLLKAPSRYSPHNNIELAKKRSQLVLSAMKDAGYINDSDMTKSNLSISLPNKKYKSGQNMRYFADWVIDGLDDIIGHPDMDLIIETTLNTPLQEYAQKTIKDTIDNTNPNKHLSQGAALIMSPDGAVLSMIGGYDYGKSQFNRTTQSRRAAGSVFKPIIYLSAIEQGWKPYSKILDAPITDGEYRPKNFANKYYGMVSLEEALSKSMNSATLRLAKTVGISNIIKTARKLGITSKLERNFSLALGSSGISMMEMGVVYSTFANGGYRVFPYAIERITTKEGRILFERKKQILYQSVINRKHIQEITKMLETVINEGTGRAAKLPFPASGKTGTSQDSRDAWFAGYNNKIVTIIWLGNDDNSPMKGITGGNIPAIIWRNIMLYANSNLKTLPELPDQFKNNINNIDKKHGISGLLDRLLSNESKNNHHNKWQNKKPRSDYSHLND